MPIITLLEIFYLIITSLVVGFIFSGIYSTRIKTVYDYEHPRRFIWQDYLFAILVAAPAVILHELGHKFVAMAFGYAATFTVWFFGLALGVVLKAIGSPFILFAPGYVGISNVSNPSIMSLIAFSGPAINLILWLTSYFVLKTKKHMSRKEIAFWGLSKQINMWLFIFNMLPIPPLDGSKVLFGLIQGIF